MVLIPSAFSALVACTWISLATAPPTALLAAADKALKDTTSVAYDATLVMTPNAGDAPTTMTCEVMLKRSDDQRGVGWKLYIGAKESAGGQPLHLAFDGFAGRSLKQHEKIVYEKNAKDLAALESFLVHQSARDVLVWPLLARSSLAEPALVKDVRGEGVETVAAQACDVLVVPGPGPASQTMYYMDVKDHFPRRIDVLETPPADQKQQATGAGVQPRVVRSLVLANVRRNVPIAESTFIVDVPDEFMVKAVKETPAPGAKDKPGKQASAAPPAGGLLAPGTVAPAWSLKDGAGKPVQSTDFAGKVVVLDFWGSWCPPCRAAMPAVQKIHEKYKDKGVVVLGMNFERSASADPVKFMAENRITYRLVRGAETIADAYKVPGWPTFYVIGRDGEIVWGSVGFNKAEEARHVKDMSDAIDAALSAGV